jgi:CBS domain-containing protein
MKVGDVMARSVELVGADDNIQAAARQMAEYDIGAILVGTPDRLDGILTDRDIIVRMVVEGRDPKDMRVREAMSSKLCSCGPDDPIEAAFQAMRDHQIRRMPVLDAGGKLVGIVTMSDLAKASPVPEPAAQALREIADPHRNTAGPADDADEAEDAAGAPAADPEAGRA